MKTAAQMMADLWADRFPVRPAKKLQPLDEIARVQWSPTFERLMRNRLIMGGIRHGLIPDQRKRPYTYNVIAEAHKRLAKYEQTGNTELLVDVANFMLLAFELDEHPTKHFRADDDAEHCERK